MRGSNAFAFPSFSVPPPTASFTTSPSLCSHLVVHASPLRSLHRHPFIHPSALSFRSVANRSTANLFVHPFACPFTRLFVHSLCSLEHVPSHPPNVSRTFPNVPRTTPYSLASYTVDHHVRIEDRPPNPPWYVPCGATGHTGRC